MACEHRDRACPSWLPTGKTRVGTARTPNAGMTARNESSDTIKMSTPPANSNALPRTSGQRRSAAEYHERHRIDGAAFGVQRTASREPEHTADKDVADSQTDADLEGGRIALRYGSQMTMPRFARLHTTTGTRSPCVDAEPLTERTCSAHGATGIAGRERHTGRSR